MSKLSTVKTNKKIGTNIYFYAFLALFFTMACFLSYFFYTLLGSIWAMIQYILYLFFIGIVLLLTINLMKE